MAEVLRLTGDVYVNGTIQAKTLVPSAGCITNTHVAAAADIVYSKLEHLIEKGYSQEIGTNAADEGRVIHVVRGLTGVVLGFCAGAIVAATGDAVCTIDLKKNGTTMLTAPISLDSGDAAYAIVAATLSVTALAVDDVLTIVIDGTIGTGALAKGIFCAVKLSEKAN